MLRLEQGWVTCLPWASLTACHIADLLRTCTLAASCATIAGESWVCTPEQVRRPSLPPGRGSLSDAASAGSFRQLSSHPSFALPPPSADQHLQGDHPVHTCCLLQLNAWPAMFPLQLTVL